MKTMKDYHDLYLKCNNLLLGGVFEKFRNNSLKNYGLRPSHYLSAPVLGWDAMLRMTKIKIEFIPDPYMYVLFEKGTRGKFSYILTDAIQSRINIWNLMALNRKQNIFYP